MKDPAVCGICVKSIVILQSLQLNCGLQSSQGVSWAEPGNCVIDKAQCNEFDF